MRIRVNTAYNRIFKAFKLMMGAFEFPSCPTGVSKKGFKEF
jgi:hypothetical protein